MLKCLKCLFPFMFVALLHSDPTAKIEDDWGKASEEVVDVNSGSCDRGHRCGSSRHQTQLQKVSTIKQSYLKAVMSCVLSLARMGPDYYTGPSSSKNHQLIMWFIQKPNLWSCNCFREAIFLFLQWSVYTVLILNIWIHFFVFAGRVYVCC